jgi:hypothetical protein
LVAGAIAATFVDSRMNVPAEAARAPDGEPHRSPGPSCSGRLRDRRIDEASPPGVSIVSSTVAAPASAAGDAASTWSATRADDTVDPQARRPGEADCASAQARATGTPPPGKRAPLRVGVIITSPPSSSHRRTDGGVGPTGTGSVGPNSRGHLASNATSRGMMTKTHRQARAVRRAYTWKEFGDIV